MADAPISGSVGEAGGNRAIDVALVQYLLNCVPVSAGGPARELAVDGVCGPRTLAAIRGFAAGGRIEPGDGAWARLSGFDPLPQAALDLAGKIDARDDAGSRRRSAAEAAA